MSRYRNGYNDSSDYHRGSYYDYDHSDEEIYVYDQCCRNCRYFRRYGFPTVCAHPEHDEFDTPADNGSDWCELWKGKRGRR